MKNKLILYLKGGLGNQLFQISFIDFLQKNFYPHHKILLDISGITSVHDKTGILQIPIPFQCIPSKKLLKYKLVKIFFCNLYMFIRKFRQGIIISDENWHSIIFKNNSKNDLIVDGYFENKYFPLNSVSLNSSKILYNLKNTEYANTKFNYSISSNDVLIHVRREDFVEINKDIEFEYYLNALTFLIKIKKIPLENIYWMGRDINWIKQNLVNALPSSKYNYIYLDEAKDNTAMDLIIFSQNFKNLVLANSTLSWWISWFNPEALTIFPNDRGVKPDTYIDLKLPWWVLIEY